MRVQPHTIDTLNYQAKDLALDNTPAEHLAIARMLRIVADNITAEVKGHEKAAAAKDAAQGRDRLSNTGEVER